MQVGCGPQSAVEASRLPASGVLRLEPPALVEAEEVVWDVDVETPVEELPAVEVDAVMTPDEDEPPPASRFPATQRLSTHVQSWAHCASVSQ